MRSLLILSLIIGLTACQRPSLYHEQILSMGTLVEVTLISDNSEQLSEAQRIIQEDLDYMHYAWHAWNPGPLKRVNQLLASGEEFSINPSILPLVQQSQQLSRQSKGLFNPALGKLIALWGYHSSEMPVGPPPSQAEIQALLAQHPSMDDIEIHGVRVRCHNPAVQLDFGGFAKGYGLAQILEHLKSIGIENTILNAGGDLVALGSKGDKRWRIGIRNPRPQEEGDSVLASVEIAPQGEAVFTSGDYERFYKAAGKRYHHIIDPRSGMPAKGIASATVIHTDAALADAAATALLIAGVDGWQEIARNMGLRYVMLVDEERHIYLTPEMKERLKMESKSDFRLVVSEL